MHTRHIEINKITYVLQLHAYSEDKYKQHNIYVNIKLPRIFTVGFSVFFLVPALLHTSEAGSKDHDSVHVGQEAWLRLPDIDTNPESDKLSAKFSAQISAAGGLGAGVAIFVLTTCWAANHQSNLGGD